MEFPHSQYNVLELEDKVTVFCRPNSATTSGQLRQIVKSCTSIQLFYIHFFTMLTRAVLRLVWPFYGNVQN